VVAIDGLLRVDAPDRADLQPSTSYRVAWRARILSQKALPNVAPISTTRGLVDAAAVAAYLGMERGWVHEHADELGARGSATGRERGSGSASRSSISGSARARRPCSSKGSPPSAGNNRCHAEHTTTCKTRRK
jgi:hypothetical protein